MSEFTPGPWIIRSTHPHSIVDGKLKVEWDKPKSEVAIWLHYLDNEGRRCQRPIADVHLIGSSEKQERLDEQQANANLIAAAPDLHDALKAFFDFFNQEGRPYHIAKHNNRFTAGEQEAIDKMFADAAAALVKAVPE